MQDHMTDAEKIEALRKWAEAADRPSLNDYYLIAVRQVRDIIDPPKPQWRESVDRCVKAFPSDPLGDVLMHLSALSVPKADDATRAWHLANIVAVCEDQVGDGWQADPERVHSGFWGIAWLLVPLSHEPPDWTVVGHRSAAWLRSLTDGGAA